MTLSSKALQNSQLLFDRWSIFAVTTIDHGNRVYRDRETDEFAIKATINRQGCAGDSCADGAASSVYAASHGRPHPTGEGATLSAEYIVV
jgi:hypothetical protein